MERKPQSLNRALLIAFCCALSLGFGFKCDNEQRQALGLIDSTINKKLRLEDPLSLKQLLGSSRNVHLIEGLRESPVACFVNSSGTEYLLAFKYEGDTKNAFACFELGYVKSIKLPKEYIKLKSNTFFTETGVHLGMLRHDLIRLKGIPTNDRHNKINYSIDANSPFVKRYRMPGYFLQCETKESRVSVIKFGFEYP
jgi:hypothetical protein